MRDVPETLIIGADGLVGRHLLAAYRKVHPHTLGTTRRRRPDGQTQSGLAYLDLANPDLNALPLKSGNYLAAIIAAAASKVAQCAGDPESTRQVNVTGTMRLIEQLWDRGILPIFLSSDYVFDGTSLTGCADDEPLCPSTEYGRQKAEVEQALSASGKPYLVCRLSKTYGLDKGDGTLLDEIAARLMAGQVFSAAYDQRFCPTFAGDLPAAIMELQAREPTGMVNLCAAQSWSRWEIAQAVARHLGAPERLIQRISLDDLPGNLVRPKNTSLIPRRLQRETAAKFISLEEGLMRLGTLYRNLGT
jgi:dTDP-4-dehydrorhamnose reductase